MSSHITWQRVNKKLAEGYLNHVLIFQLEVSNKGTAWLTCELPNLKDNQFGRSVTLIEDPTRLKRIAELQLQHWLTRAGLKHEHE